MQLKTLRDLRGLDRPICLHEMDTPRYSNDKNEDFAFVLRDDLKQEAIKWVKKFIEARERFKSGMPNMKTLEIPEFIEDKEQYEKIVLDETTCAWIQYFFNITEGELKSDN